MNLSKQQLVIRQCEIIRARLALEIEFEEIISQLDKFSNISNDDAYELRDSWIEWQADAFSEYRESNVDIAEERCNKMTAEEVFAEILEYEITSSVAVRIHADREANLILLGDRNA